MEETYIEGTCIRKGRAHEGSYTLRDIHIDENSSGETDIWMNIYTEENVSESIYTCTYRGTYT